MMKTNIITTVIALAVFAACKDKTDKTSNPKPKYSVRQQALIGKDWRLASIKFQGIDFTQALPECFKDNIVHHFTDEKSGYTDEGTTKCDQLDSQRVSLSWKLIANESKMVVKQAGYGDTFEIIRVGNKELEYLYEGQSVVLRHP